MASTTRHTWALQPALGMRDNRGHGFPKMVRHEVHQRTCITEISQLGEVVRGTEREALANASRAEHAQIPRARTVKLAGNVCRTG